jgi:hypothetical protein
MQDLANNAEESVSLSIPRATPSARFIQGLGREIQAAARRQVGTERGMPFEEMVVELRKLVRLLCKTLVPVEPSSGFTAALRGELVESAEQSFSERHRRARWLMVGGVLGSALSLLGLVAALLLRRRNGRLHTKKPVGAA